MKKNILFLTFLFPVFAFCQSKDIHLVIGGGPSMHGTGDLSGYSFLNQVEIKLNDHFFVSPGIQITNNSKTNQLTYFQLNYVSAGINVFANINYFVLNRSRHHLSVGAGPLVRFQNSSVPVEAGTNINAAGEPILFIKYDKLQSVSFGYNISPAYYFQCTKKISAGTKFILQNDTRGDVIKTMSLFVGIKL